MNANRTVIVPFDNWDFVQESGLYIPRGDLLVVGLSPWRPDVHVRFQDNPDGRMFATHVLQQLADTPDLFERDARAKDGRYCGVRAVVSGCKALERA